VSRVHTPGRVRFAIPTLIVAALVVALGAQVWPEEPTSGRIAEQEHVVRLTATWKEAYVPALVVDIGYAIDGRATPVEKPPLFLTNSRGEAEWTKTEKSTALTPKVALSIRTPIGNRTVVTCTAQVDDEPPDHHEDVKSTSCYYPRVNGKR
jgi:hypothetical protein